MNRTVEHPSQPRTRGPHAGILAIVVLALTLAAVGLPALITGHPGYLDPSAGPAEALRQARQRHTALRVNGFLLIGSAPPLAVCAAAWCARFRRRGLTVPGPLIALAGGVLAAGLLIVSGTAQWALSRSAGDLAPGLARLIGQFSFALGGVGFCIPFGLLLAGVAVTGLLSRALPAPTAWAGIGLAGLAELSWLVLVVPAADPVLPVVRFAGLAWLIVAGFAPAPVREGR